MSQWRSSKAAALLRIGWTIKRKAKGSHHVLSRPGWSNYIFAFHDREEIGPRMLSRIARHTGLKPEDILSTAKLSYQQSANSKNLNTES